MLCDSTPRDNGTTPTPSQSLPQGLLFPPPLPRSDVSSQLLSSPELLKAPNCQFKYTAARRASPPPSFFVPPAAPRSRRHTWNPGHWPLFFLLFVLFLCSLPPYRLEPVVILPTAQLPVHAGPCQQPTPASPRGLSISAACQNSKASGAHSEAEARGPQAEAPAT